MRGEEGEISYKHIDKHIEELSPEDRMDRIRAELARIEWLRVGAPDKTQLHLVVGLLRAAPVP